MLFFILNSIYEFRHSFDLGAASMMQLKSHCSLGERQQKPEEQFLSLAHLLSSRHLTSGKAAKQTENTTPNHQATQILWVFNHGTEIFFPVKSHTVDTVIKSSFKRQRDEVCLCPGTVLL